MKLTVPSDDTYIRGQGEDEDFIDDGLVMDNILSKPKINPVVDCCVTGVAYIQFFWIFRRLELILGLVLFVSVSLAVTGVIESYEKRYHPSVSKSIFHDYSDVKSPLELKIGSIDHWCLDGRDDSCPKCDDPLEPLSRAELKTWRHAYTRNHKSATIFAQAQENPDVIFIGDGIIEATQGELLGLTGLAESPAAEDLDVVKLKYDNKFMKSNGGKYDALRLGIAGDSSPNLLWRIKQNEFRSLKPKVWWLSIGRSDLFRTSCSEEVALVGAIRIVEELLGREDGATIVINSLLPIAHSKSYQLEGKFFHNDMWQSISKVNEGLKKFSQKHKGILFFDANEVFVDSTSHRGKKYIQKGLYSDYSHPNLNGYNALIDSQIEYLSAIMEKREKSASNDNASNYRDSTASSASETDGADTGNDGEAEDDVAKYYGFDDYYATILDDDQAKGDDFLSDFYFNEDDDFYFT